MKKSLNVKKYLLVVLALLPVAAIGGYFTGIYGVDSFTPEMKAQVMEQVENRIQMFYLSTAMSSMLYAAICGFAGCIFADKLGLLKPVSWGKKELLTTIALTFGVGLILSSDFVIFRKCIPQVADLYVGKPSFAFWVSSILYGGVIEEVMMRLFLMSLIAFIVWKLFFRKSSCVPTGVLVAANIIAAMLFAVGHLPATVQMFGVITPIVLVRCFLLNGAGGLVFGYLYRKYGIHYAMLSHAGAHIVWKTIWILFV